MPTLIATFALFGIVMTAMAVGLIFRGKSLRGSCGGIGESCGCSARKRRACVASQHAEG
ncbi:MAG: hypothetical protein JRG92_07200 [Deltaproteobacteria bacterium]|nr:hypothetical protein [Deltaproteobacteria bacterium]MBW2383403.1 hypothetical protein [Deltaproteobacteria bacterium]